MTTMIIFNGENCNDCPFFSASITVDAGARLHSPTCNLNGREDVTIDKVLDIRPLCDGINPEDPIRRGVDCPFNDCHGIHVEIHNHEETS
jgi:hypothetical protein